VTDAVLVRVLGSRAPILSVLFIAAALMIGGCRVAFSRLVTSGQLDPDDTLPSWLPAEITSGIPSSDVITVRQLLQHTSGPALSVTTRPPLTDSEERNTTHAAYLSPQSAAPFWSVERV